MGHYWKPERKMDEWMTVFKGPSPCRRSVCLRSSSGFPYHLAGFPTGRDSLSLVWDSLDQLLDKGFYSNTAFWQINMKLYYSIVTTSVCFDFDWIQNGQENNTVSSGLGWSQNLRLWLVISMFTCKLRSETSEKPQVC